jgi:molybdopterin molybdotransferase
MRGFARRTTVAEVWAWIDAQAQPLPPVDVPLGGAAGRVLAADVVSTVDVPAFDRAMMDGYALRGAETQGASAYQPLEFQIVGDARPGRACACPVGPGQAVRIMTGAPLPPDCDAVLPAERCEAAGTTLRALDEVPPHRHVSRRGEDIAAGSRVLHAGRRLRPQDVGVLSSIGVSRVPVVRRPRVALLITGDEVGPAGHPPPPEGVADANGPMLQALVRRDGGLVARRARIPDSARRLSKALSAAAAACDVVLISGGSSVGEEDRAPAVLAELGELAIHGVAMRPSSPAGMGRIGNTLVFLLPGNPVSCLCAYDFFAGRAIRRLGGRGGGFPYHSVRLPLARKLASAPGRVDYARVRIVAEKVEPLAISGASLLSSTTVADGFVVVPEEQEGYPEGAWVEVYLYDSA